uniref:Nucleoprotein n=1 Tax=Karimabad virus TaxID=415382 RepID=W8JX62_9VIRU|nr:nucleocapsid protein [Karimabad virus]
MSDFASIAIEFGNEPIDRDAVSTWLNEFAYQGFDPRVIIEKITTADNWKTDVKKMIVLALTRGNKPEKMTAKMSPEGKAEVTRLVKKYKLKSGNPGRNDITLSRVAAAFATWTCNAIFYVQEFMPVNGAQMDELSPGYPRPMMHPSFAGLIDPNLPDAKMIIDAHCLFLVQFAKVINVGLRGKPKSEVYQSFVQPMTAAINSNFMTGEQRRRVLQGLGIIDMNLKPSQAVIAAARAYSSLA